MRSLFAGLMVLSLALAGCSGGKSTADAKGIVDPDGEGTLLSGQIVDDQLQPVAGATVALRKPDGGEIVAQAETNEAGRFDFGRVPPGTYEMAIQALGYESLLRVVVLVAGVDQSGVSYTLKPIPVAESFYETVPKTLHIQIGFAWAVGGDFNQGCIVEGVTCNAYADPPPNLQFHAMDPKESPLASIVLEETWEPNSPICAKTIAVDLYGPETPSTANPSFQNPHYWTNYPSQKWKTTSPIVMVIPRNETGNSDSVDDPARVQKNAGLLGVKGNWTARHFPPGKGLTNLAVDANCFTDQTIDVYWTSFYLSPAPEGFSARPDA